ncbi:probable serine/threonine-protein kinase PBL28 [Hibiscus syriacus]|uniref:probable serine/threonine-protein kinase PBL28 n=1 Tax=Hibiscus syriacus TaxID=106335 RepID=UPI001924842D|nr:probable serine/threonine-protein kinase PBL28 [Hibiscus syriacus]
MPLRFASAWKKRRRCNTRDHTDPCIYKPAEYWGIEDQMPQQTKRRHGSSIFTLKEMEEATRSFSDKNLLGKGGFGRVYKGTLQSREVVAIKKMELPPSKVA